MVKIYCLPLLLCFYLVGCKNAKEKETFTLFELVLPTASNVDFINQLPYDEQFNIFTYRNFYNGGGVALGDINNDGLIDIFFTANVGKNKLYLNKGNFVFEDITDKAGIRRKGNPIGIGWSTGVSMADINGDGLLDIYICNSGDLKDDDKQNELYINNGNATFSEQASAYGINDKGYSTHASFFDFDHDGDLDFFLLNNSFKAIGTFNLQNNERNLRDYLGGHKFFRNDGDHFTDISAEAGIFGSIIGFGLGVTAGDINGDGWDDIYVSNDFFERDYLYINNENGTFTESLEKQMQSISNASMGADMADINNDGRPDIFVTEMLPEEEDRLKTNTNFENWDKYQLNLKYDYYHQFSRNMLHLNNGNNSFSEIGRLAGVCATDWSWGALITDLDNDGMKDIYISNGIYQDLTNGDYIQYISNREIMKNILSSKDRNKKLIDAMASHPISNYAYCNNGDLTFNNKATEWGLAQPGFSNGAAYGDLDNDGDMDLVVNNVNMPSFLYRNNSNLINPLNKYLKIILKGTGKNSNGIGARVTVWYNHQLGYQEQMPMRGFQSSVDDRLNFGLGKTEMIDSVNVKWTDGKISQLKNILPNQTIIIRQSESKSAPLLGLAVKPTKIFTEHPALPGLNFVHKENEYSDFDREKLIFEMLSTAGPALDKGDVNGDELDDLFIGGAKDQPGGLYIQLPGGKFRKSNQQLFEKDKESEDTDCLFFDADGDKDLDLYVCSGGNEFSGNSTALANRLYQNDGHGNFSKSPQLLPSAVFMSNSCVSATDYDNDGDLDLFVGTRLLPTAYGQDCKSFILENNGKGVFNDVTMQIAPGLLHAGMVTDGKWFDYDRDGKTDLVIAGEYMPVKIFHNENGHLKEVTIDAGLGNSNGWWNKIMITDINNDGYPDIVAGNHGLNSRFKASLKKPVSMYVSDFDGNGYIEQIVATYNGDRQYPMALRHDLVSVLPYLKKKYLTYEQYKEQSVSDIFTQPQLQKALRLDAFELRSSIIMNKGNSTFAMVPLPMEAQFSPVYAIAVNDYNHDGNLDILLGGNLYQCKPETGIYDASYGLLLKGDGKGGFVPLKDPKSGLHIRGAVRNIREIKAGDKNIIIIGMNNDSPKILSYE